MDKDPPTNAQHKYPASYGGVAMESLSQSAGISVPEPIPTIAGADTPVIVEAREQKEPVPA